MREDRVQINARMTEYAIERNRRSITQICQLIFERGSCLSKRGKKCEFTSRYTALLDNE